MKGNKKVLHALQQALTEELSAVNEYFLHSELIENMGLGKLGDVIKKNAVDEMKHAEALIERIIFLEGMPEMLKFIPIAIGTTVPDILKNDLKLEYGAVKSYNEAVNVAREVNDEASAALFTKHLKDEEGHTDWLETQIELIKTMGLENYLTTWK